MNGGPYRTPQPSERRVINNRPEATQRQEEPQVAQTDPRRAYHTSAPQGSSGRRPLKRIIVPVVALIIVIVLVVVGWQLFSNSGSTTASAIDGGKYQAVFFTNGQVYFGKLQAFNSDYMKLTDVFYLQTKSSTTTTSSNPQNSSGSSTSGDVQLVKLGSEIHGPTDEMLISKQQVLFFENLKSDGKVASSIDQYNKQNNK